MSQKSNGINVLTNLEIGTDELQWWQTEFHERQRFLRMARMALPGWFDNQKYSGTGIGRYGWQITENGTTGELLFRSIFSTGSLSHGTQSGNHRSPQRYGGIMPDGSVIELDYADNIPVRDTNFAQITVPDDATWHTLVAVYEAELEEPGRITLTQNSSTVVGERTHFSRYSDGTDPVASIIRIDPADTANGHEGEYTIVSITDDTVMTVSPTPTAATETVRYRVKGKFFAAPSGEQDCHRNVRVVWQLRTRTNTPPPDALVAYDVYRDTGLSANVFFVDRRAANTYRTMPEVATTVRVIPDPTVTGAGTSSTWSDSLIDQAYDITAGTLLGADCAACQADRLVGSGSDYGGLLVVYYTSTEVRSIVSRYNVATGGNSVADGSRITLGGITAISLEAIAGGHGGWTHILGLSTANKILMSRSADNGATFAATSTIWDPTTIHASDTVKFPAVLFTKWHRIVIAGVYTDHTGPQTIRYIYSDDYGDTWQTNANAGFTAVSGVVDPRDIELVQDGWGNIHGVYVEDNGGDDDLWTWVGTDPNDPTINNGKARSLNRGSFMVSTGSPAFGSVMGHPRAVAFDDGTVVTAVPQQTPSSSVGTVKLAFHKEDELLNIHHLWINPEEGTAGTNPPVVIMDQVNGGGLAIGSHRSSETPNPNLTMLRAIPLVVPIGPQWPGGR